MYHEKIRSQILEGSLADFPGHLSGVYRGYHVSIQNRNAQFIVKINAHMEGDVNNGALAQFLERQKEISRELLKVDVFPYMAVLTIKGPNLAKNIPSVLNENLMPVFQFLSGNGYVSGCEQCGSDNGDVHCYEVNGDAHILCNNCRGELEVALQNYQQQKRSEKSRLVPGLVGAFLGSLIGCALWVVIYRLGYIAGIAGAVTAICAMKGYEMLGGHLDRKGVAGSAIIMVVMIYFANRLAWAWAAYSALGDYGWGFFECFQYLGSILESSDLTGNYMGDLIIGYVLTAVCIIRPIVQAFRTSSGEYTVK